MLSDGSVIFPFVLALMSISTQNYHASPLSQVTNLHFLNLLIFLFMDVVRGFCDFFPDVPASMSIGMQNSSFYITWNAPIFNICQSVIETVSD